MPVPCEQPRSPSKSTNPCEFKCYRVSVLETSGSDSGLWHLAQLLGARWLSSFQAVGDQTEEPVASVSFLSGETLFGSLEWSSALLGLVPKRSGSLLVDTVDTATQPGKLAQAGMGLT